jgi:hypothetical protein
VLVRDLAEGDRCPVFGDGRFLVRSRAFLIHFISKQRLLYRGCGWLTKGLGLHPQISGWLRGNWPWNLLMRGRRFSNILSCCLRVIMPLRSEDGSYTRSSRSNRCTERRFCLFNGANQEYQALGRQSTSSHKPLHADTCHSAHLFIGQAGELVSFRATSRSLWLGNFLGPGNLADLHVSPSFLQH